MKNSHSAELQQLQNHFLVATPRINDEIFQNTVIYVCQHNNEGSMGIVINQPTSISVAEIIAQSNFMMAKERSYPASWVLAGGPVNTERGFILHTPTKQQFINSRKVSERLCLTTSIDIIDILGTDQEPEKYLVALGCAGWSEGQLEKEIRQNVWQVLPADEKILFDTDYLQRWDEVYKQLGVNIHSLASYVGNA
ncbi:hypothetical protein CEP49_04125 [Mergibacter septicus]|uniref:YqgE/AlgH family protein n=1 Tax=Mergibacter septicus TaxID=221402 RepID=UPI001178F798|nr:YqgE/AlgH family protein [Mergibacter septicus]AWX14623.1 hypothetical protein CEP49_04125 [Mergibacter septicus]